MILYKPCIFYPSWQATSIERPPSWVIHHVWPPLLKGHHLGLFIMTGHLYWKATILGYPSWLATPIERPPSWVIHHVWPPLLKGHHLGLFIMTGHLFWKATILRYPSWLATPIERPPSWVIHHDWPPLLKGHHLGWPFYRGSTVYRYGQCPKQWIGKCHNPIAQQLEHSACNRRVVGSITSRIVLFSISYNAMSHFGRNMSI